MTGFEPATTRPPDVYANRTAPHPEIYVNILLFDLMCALTVPIAIADAPHPEIYVTILLFDPTCTLTVPIDIADAPNPEFGFEISIFRRK